MTDKYGPKTTMVIQRAYTLSQEEIDQLEELWYEEDRYPAMKRLLVNSRVIAAAVLDVLKAVPMRYAGAHNAISVAVAAIEAQERNLISESDFYQLTRPWREVIGDNTEAPPQDDGDLITNMDDRSKS